MKTIMVRLLLLVSVAMMPAIGFLAYSETQARNVRQHLMEDDALRLVRLVSSEQQRIFEGAQQVLTLISGSPFLEDNIPGQCRRLLAHLVDKSPRYNSAAVIDLDGHIVCSPGPLNPRINASDRAYFRLALQTGGFVVGDYTMGRYSKQPSLHLAQPLRAEDGAITGVVDVALNLEWLRQQLEHLALPTGAAVSIMDRNGTTLARFPDGERAVGQPMPADNHDTLEGDEIRVATMKSRDGRERIVGYSPLGADPKGLLVAVGLDRALTFGEVAEANNTGIGLIFAGAALALAMTVLLSKPLVQRPFNRLLVVADHWRTKDFAARVGLPRDGSEFGRLARALDAMAEAQEARERALRNALESTTDSVMVLDRAWRFSYLNERAKTQTAQGRDLLGQVIWEAFPDLAGSAFGAACRRAMEQGVPTQMEGYYAPLERHFDATAYPSNDGLTIFFRDVTEERRIAAVLWRSEQYFRATFQQAAIGMAHVGLDGTWLEVNARLCAITGYTEAELLASRVQDITHPDDFDRTLSRVHALLACEISTYAMEKRYLRKDGSITWVSLTVALLRDTKARPERFIAVIEDIEARKQAEAALHHEVTAREEARRCAAHGERMQALGQLAGGIAHDFNNVLQAVAGAASLIERRPADEDGVRRLARVALEASDRGASITRRLLAFGHRADLRAEALDADALLGDLREIFVHTLGAAIEVEVSLEAGLSSLLADKGQLETALINLATNARDGMPNGGRLILAARAEVVAAEGPAHPAGLAPGRYVRLTVADTGVGMDATTLARATEPFFTTKGVGIGTGLGLSMVKGFAEQSGGAVSIDSSPGKGTTVTVWLPETVSARPPIATSPQLAANAAVTRSITVAQVLVIDDEDMVRETVAETLEAAGFGVVTAANGSEALALLAAGEQVDVLMTDLSMPGMDGLAVIREAQKLRPNLPALLVTGYAGDAATLAVGGIVSGSFSLLSKPVRAAHLIDRIETLLEGRQKARQTSSSYTNRRRC